MSVLRVCRTLLLLWRSEYDVVVVKKSTGDKCAVPVRNFTIRFMPIPIVDAAQALKTNLEKTEDALLKVPVLSSSGHL